MIPKILLASSSPYRKALLEQLGYPFQTAHPNIDESPLAHESPYALVKRLAKQKALALGTQYPAHLIIGSDQVACLAGNILTKPGSHEVATHQLETMSGKTVEFITGLCVYNSETSHCHVEQTINTVSFRQLTTTMIEYYLRTAQPYQCAASFKSESLGAALITSMQGDDPSALIGLPLIKLTDILLQEGIPILG